MASLPASCSIPTTSLLPSYIFTKSPHIAARSNRFEVRCENSSPETESQSSNNKLVIDRRNVLLGIGTGLYGASSNYLNASPASASPIQSPDLSKCTLGTNLNTGQPLPEKCCLPAGDYKPIDYKLPPVLKKRLRPAAHLASKDYIAKYEKALALMKALPDNDPRNFMQQANVHCAYCNLSYPQTGDSQLKLQVHESWLFYPFHRWYLYFYERILGKLIDDPTFAIPFWNWDNPDGMYMPDMFVKGGSGSPLYDALRNTDHFPPAIANLNYDGTDPADTSKIIPNNLAEMYTEMIRNASKLTDFYGARYVTGTEPQPGPGTVERGSHTAIHRWTGSTTTPSGEDMGNFYSAGRDPIFYGHHGNVDRLWSIWRSLRGGKPKDFYTREWLDANFVFYDENAQLVKVRVGDSLENDLMGYTYQEVPIPWLTNRPKARVKKSRLAKTSGAPSPKTVFPVKLNKIVKVVVDRPKKSMRNKEKKGQELEEQEELLVIEGIEVDTARFVKFDVFVNDEDDNPNDFDKAEYAGGYAQLPRKNSGKATCKIRLGLTELLEDLDVEDDDQLLVTLVPKAGGDYITIGGIKIIYDV